MSKIIFTLLVIFICSEALADPVDKDYSFNAAEAHYSAREMRVARAKLRAEMGGMPIFLVMADRLEFRDGDDEDGITWDAQGWYGGDINKLLIKSEGEYSKTLSETEDAELEVLWSRAVTPFFDFQLGFRHDFEPDGLGHAVIGMQGLAPYWFEVDAAAYLSEDGDLTAGIEAEYEWLFTQRLILQWRGELQASASDIPQRQLGAGLTGLDLGFRLRYEIIREFAPYIGFEYSKALGQTADLIEAGGADNDDFALIAGLRFWF